MFDVALRVCLIVICLRLIVWVIVLFGQYINSFIRCDFNSLFSFCGWFTLGWWCFDVLCLRLFGYYLSTWLAFACCYKFLFERLIFVMGLLFVV